MRRMRTTRETLGWGVFLIAAGGGFLLLNNGILPHDALRAWWPLFVILAGVGSLVGAEDAKGVGSAVTLMGIGMWMLVAANDWYGLGWNRSWPLVLVAIGLGTVTKTLGLMIGRPRQEDGDVE